MIVFPVLSEVKSTNDSLVTYTKSENRKIAILLEKGNYYKQVHNNDSATIVSQKYIILEKDKQLLNTNTILIDCKAQHDSLSMALNKSIDRNQKLVTRNKNATTWAVSSTVSTLLLIIIILL